MSTLARDSYPLRVNPGELRHRLQILQDASRVSNPRTDSFGEPQPVWSKVAERWGSIEHAVAGREFWYGMQMVSDTTHIVKMRVFPGLTPQMALGFQGRRFEIVSVGNPGAQGKTTVQVIQVKEVTT